MPGRPVRPETDDEATTRALPMATDTESKPRADDAEAARPDLLDEADELHQALTDLVRVHLFRDRDRVCCFDISITQSHAFERLMRRGPMTLQELGHELFLDKSTISRMVASLERRGYVRRRPNPDDGRSVLLELTRRGARVAETIDRETRRDEAELLGDFDGEARRALTEGIRRLADAAAARARSRD